MGIGISVNNVILYIIFVCVLLFVGSLIVYFFYKN